MDKNAGGDTLQMGIRCAVGDDWGVWVRCTGGFLIPFLSSTPLPALLLSFLLVRTCLDGYSMVG